MLVGFVSLRCCVVCCCFSRAATWTGTAFNVPPSGCLAVRWRNKYRVPSQPRLLCQLQGMERLPLSRRSSGGF